MLTVKFSISDHPERLEEKIDIDIIEDEISFFESLGRFGSQHPKAGRVLCEARAWCAVAAGRSLRSAFRRARKGSPIVLIPLLVFHEQIFWVE